MRDGTDNKSGCTHIRCTRNDDKDEVRDPYAASASTATFDSSSGVKGLGM